MVTPSRWKTTILHWLLALASSEGHHCGENTPKAKTGSVIERYRRGVLRGLREENPGRGLGRRPYRPRGEGPARYRRDGALEGHEPARVHLRGLPEGPAYALRPRRGRLPPDAADPEEDRGVRRLPREQGRAGRPGRRPAPRRGPLPLLPRR